MTLLTYTLFVITGNLIQAPAWYYIFACVSFILDLISDSKNKKDKK